VKEPIHNAEGREYALREFDPAEMFGDKLLSERETLAKQVLLLRSQVHRLQNTQRAHSRIIAVLCFAVVALAYHALK
jgi:hypothetical protein